MLSGERKGMKEAGVAPLLQTRLPDVPGDVQGDVEEGEGGDGEALTLEAEGGVVRWWM